MRSKARRGRREWGRRVRVAVRSRLLVSRGAGHHRLPTRSTSSKSWWRLRSRSRSKIDSVLMAEQAHPLRSAARLGVRQNQAHSAKIMATHHAWPAVSSTITMTTCGSRPISGFRSTITRQNGKSGWSNSGKKSPDAPGRNRKQSVATVPADWTRPRPAGSIGSPEGHRAIVAIQDARLTVRPDRLRTRNRRRRARRPTWTGPPPRPP